ncbi:MAG: cytochrome b/b6 domain-containing protein [Bacteroidetes bacterium]|nr:cytochrome b/b6 domain-containing protein [Bacteroidota bacterium]MBU1371307.1 cytochrome b/b6 domain-containing protein [Bacteroidota bacterium]MBU1485794.1 cytochrome b/b6 domain-containing protein [Bacteroidota bacterium]MBU1761586.1 cytochrome b/b6 domain-containing protein [Bacteroidota bacterium]MBU2045683.1 cytochrome b/b6 domain-containing protein [Bacteroidota bacterium]
METNPQSKQEKRKYSSALRLWHWLNTLVITGLLTTVLINSTLNDRRGAVQAYQENTKNVSLDAAQIQSVIHQQEDRVWDIHIYFGYALTALLVFRLVLEFFQLADQKFIRILKVTYQHYKETKEHRFKAQKKFGVKLVYAVFYLLLLVMVSTGLTLVFKNDLGIPKTISHNVKEVHGFSMYLILAFIAAHLMGVYLAERKDQKGITSDMINGGD